MKKILVYYYNEEVELHSTNSNARLVASLINGLNEQYAISYFTFQSSQQKNEITAKPVFISISKWARLSRKITNELGFKRVHWFNLKRNAVRKYAARQKDVYDAILVLGLNDVTELRTYFPSATILYWIHNISAICKKEYLYNVNDADYLLSPSRTTYHLLLQKLQPVPLTAEFCFIPNWCEDVFKQTDDMLANTLKEKHAISDNSIVFIFSGGDVKLKGKFILEKVIEKLSVNTKQELIFLFAGSNKNKGTYQVGNIRIIDIGLLQPLELAAYYQLSSFGCFPSLAYDHCPLTLIEMVHCNVLPIASDIGGIKEMLGDGYQLLINEPHAVDNWISQIQNAISLSNRERLTILTGLKERVVNTYSRDEAINVFEDIMLFAK